MLTNPDGSEPRLLRKGTTVFDVGATWAPDGTRIAFMRAAGGRSRVQIYTMNADGSGVRQLTVDGTNVLPSWSPDGRKIAFLGGSRRRSWEIRIMNADGTGKRRLAAGRVPGPSPLGLPPVVPDTSSPLMRTNAAPSDLLNDEPVWRPGGR